MNDKEKFIDFWGLDPASPETERIWQEKLLMHQKSFDSTMVIADIQPYQSMVDGSMITSRSQHRDHLKQHGMIEIGNEINYHMKQPERKVDREGIREAIAQSLNQHRR